MRQKGFATIFGLCLILVVTIIVKGINDAETNHAREVGNFKTEQDLQRAAESAIVKAADFVRHAEESGVNFLPYSTGKDSDKVTIPLTNDNDDITIEAWGERGKIYFYDEEKKEIEEPHDGVYFMSRATMNDGFFGEKIYRRAYAYVRSKQQSDGTWQDDTTIYFMELPTLDGNTVTKSSDHS